MHISLLLTRKKKLYKMFWSKTMHCFFSLTSVDGYGEALYWGDSEGSKQRADADVDEDVGGTEPRWEIKHENCAQNQHHRHEDQETCGMKTQNNVWFFKFRALNYCIDVHILNYWYSFSKIIFQTFNATKASHMCSAHPYWFQCSSNALRAF